MQEMEILHLFGVNSLIIAMNGSKMSEWFLKCPAKI